MEMRKDALVAAAQRAGLPLVEDNPYGDLWYDAPPPLSLASKSLYKCTGFLPLIV